MKQFMAVIQCLFCAFILAGEVREGCATDSNPMDRSTSVVADDVWFCPNVNSPDMLNLFTDPTQWSAARSSIKVFKFYDSQVTAGCSFCGSNTLTNFVGVNAFRKLNNTWGIKIAVETGSIKSWSCDGVAAAAGTRTAIKNIVDNGGTVTYVSMDEPWMSCTNALHPNCGLTQAQAAQVVANYIAAVKQPPYQSVLIGSEEGYRQNDTTNCMNGACMLSWLAALKNAGVSLAFFHVDVDSNAISSYAQVGSDLNSIRNYCNQNGIAFGVLFAGSGGTDQAYYNSVSDWVSKCQSLIGTPQHSVFMSWAGSGSSGTPTPNGIPDNLPECAEFTHTRLINDGLSILYGSQDNSAFVSQTAPPLTMKTGQTSNVSIAMQNTGGITWDRGLQYLCYAGAVSNTWGLSAVQIPSGCGVPPDATCTFTFKVRAPSQAGKYTFRWRMKDPNRASPGWFGASSQAVTITVK